MLRTLSARCITDSAQYISLDARRTLCIGELLRSRSRKFDRVRSRTIGVGRVHGAIADHASVEGHLPAVLSREEVRAVLARLEATTRLIALILHGAGLRLEDCLKLRLDDLDFDRREIRVRRGKGGKDRVTMLPEIARAGLEGHL